jgi:ATP-dependent DNA helicase RecG
MRDEEKLQVMQKYKAGEIQILLSTTIINVGIDVPNANLMVVEYAERFGLSHLHHLRGHMGRGQNKSYCVFIMSDDVSNESRKRLSKLESTNDGNELAEWDLQFRGTGEHTIIPQSDLFGFSLADIIRDIEIFKEAKKAVLEFIERDPQMKREEHQNIKTLLAFDLRS